MIRGTGRNKVDWIWVEVQSLRFPASVAQGSVRLQNTMFKKKSNINKHL